MYQPYIRGKQFELIGLRELTPVLFAQNKDKISPIIEPVKDSSTFKSTLKELADNDINFTVIINPHHGTFQDSERIMLAIRETIVGYNNFQIGVIFSQNVIHSSIIEILQTFPDIVHSLSLIHQFMFDNISEIIRTYEEFAPIKFNVIDFSNTSRRYYRNFERSTLVELVKYK